MDVEEAGMKRKARLQRRQEQGVRTVSERIAKLIEEATGAETRVVIPGHVQRGGSPCAYDRVLSTQFGVHAAELIRDGIFGVSVALVGNTITHNPLSEIAGVPKLVPPDHQMIQIARNIGISFGAK